MNTDRAGLTLSDMGFILAAIVSWSLNRSIGWLIVHACVGWPYVIYAYIRQWS